jgi:hypothetical protein
MFGSLGLFLLSRLASGFKSGLLEVVVVVFLASAVISNGITIKRAAMRYVAWIGLAIGFATLVAPLYFSNSGLSAEELAYRLVDRETAGGALPGHVVMQESPPLVLRPSNIAVLDVKYTAYRYLGIDLGEYFNFDQIVAASIYRSPLSNLSVPVTVGAFPQLIYDTGRLIAVVLMIGIGGLYRRIEMVAVRTDSVKVYVVAVSALLALTGYLTKGDLIYLAVNWTLMVALALVMITLSSSLAQNRIPVRPSRAPDLAINADGIQP